MLNATNAKYLMDSYGYFRNLKHGFEFNDGWYGIVRQMCVQLVGGSIDPNKFQITQVKERFGILHIIWTSNGLDELDAIKVRNIIHWAIEKSQKTCELCGEQGISAKVLDSLKTLCNNCWVIIHNSED